MKGSAAGPRSHTKADVIGAGDLHIDGVFEPFARRGPADVIAAARVRGGLDVDVIVAIGAAIVSCIGIVISDVLPTRVVVLGLNRAWQRPR